MCPTHTITHAYRARVSKRELAIANVIGNIGEALIAPTKYIVCCWSYNASIVKWYYIPIGCGATQNHLRRILRSHSVKLSLLLATLALNSTVAHYTTQGLTICCRQKEALTSEDRSDISKPLQRPFNFQNGYGDQLNPSISTEYDKIISVALIATQHSV